MSINIKEKPADFVVRKDFAYKKQGCSFELCVCGPVHHTSGWKTFFLMPCRYFQFFSAAIFVTNSPSQSQSQDPRIHGMVSSSNIFENFKFSKMSEEKSILRIQGSCDSNKGGGLSDENRSQKIEPLPKKLKMLAQFFQPRFLSPYPPHPITISAGSSNLRYWVFVKHFWEFTHRNRRTLKFAILCLRQQFWEFKIQYREFMCPAIAMGVRWGDGGWWKPRLKKLKTSAERWKKRFSAESAAQL